MITMVFEKVKRQLMKNKKIMIFLFLLMIISIIGVSYALWQLVLKQSETNQITTSCFKINFKEKDDINIENAYPITDEEGEKLTPYTFTIENICNTSAFYQINLEELTSTSKRLSNNYIKVSLNKSTGKILSTYQSVDITLDNADTSHKLTTGRLSENETKDFELRLWLDNDTPLNEDTISASFMSKITIITVHQKDFDNDLSVDAKSLTENYTNTEEVIEFKVTSRDYNIIEVSEDNIVFNPVDVPAKKVTINKTYTEDGTYTMYFKDEVGNIIEKTVDTTKLDKIAPTIKVEANELQDGIKVNLSKSTDNKSGVKKYYYKLNDSEYIESTSSTHTFTNLPDGKYNIAVKLEDNAENFTDEKTFEVTVAYEHVYISNTGSDESGNGSIDLPYATLQRAYNKVKSGGEMILLSDITATTTTNMNVTNKEVTLKSNGTNIYSVTKATTLTSGILDINNQNTITTTNITFDGNDIVSTNPLIITDNSTLTLGVNTALVKNTVTTTTNDFGGGAVFARNNSTLNINGASIRNNRVVGNKSNFARGGAILVSESTLNIGSGSISSNSATNGELNQGGAIFAVESTVTMNGGTVSNNTVSTTYLSGGGGIWIQDSLFTMNNGSVVSNTANYGGGVWICGNVLTTTVNILGGNISKNTATRQGGGLGAEKLSTGSVTLTVKSSLVTGNSSPVDANINILDGVQVNYQ